MLCLCVVRLDSCVFVFGVFVCCMFVSFLISVWLNYDVFCIVVLIV